MIIISINVNINKKKDEISLKKSSFTKIKDLLTDQLFFEFSAAISAEVLSIFDSLAVRIISAKSALAILYYFLHRAMKTVLKNINLSNSAILNSVSQIVRIILSANQALTISDSDSQAVRVASLTCKSHD